MISQCATQTSHHHYSPIVAYFFCTIPLSIQLLTIISSLVLYHIHTFMLKSKYFLHAYLCLRISEPSPDIIYVHHSSFYYHLIKCSSWQLQTRAWTIETCKSALLCNKPQLQPQSWDYGILDDR